MDGACVLLSVSCGPLVSAYVVTNANSALDIYKEKKNDWVQLEIVDRAKQLDAASTSYAIDSTLPHGRRVVNALMSHLEPCSRSISLRRWTRWTARSACHLVCWAKPRKSG